MRRRRQEEEEAARGGYQGGHLRAGGRAGEAGLLVLKFWQNLFAERARRS